MTDSDQPSGDAFWSDRAHRSSRRRVERTREHTAITKAMRRPDSGTVPAASPPDRTWTPGPGLFDDIPDDPFADDFGLGTYAGLTSAAADERKVEHELVLERRDGRRAVGVDPLLARIGAIVVAAVIAVPVLGVLGGDGGGDDTAGAVESTRSPSTTASTQPPRAKRAVTASTAGRRPAALRADAGATSGPSRGEVSGGTESAGVHAIAAPMCAADYEVMAGDYWLRLADASGTALDDLLSVNGATVDTQLFPGDEICLPAGATTPAPPTTATTPTTQEPTTDAPTTEPPTTDAPSVPDPAPTTPAPTAPPPTDPPPTDPPSTDPPSTPSPTQPPVTNPPPTGDVPDIIRSVFPDHLEERALEIADRESNFDPRARNYCCYGLFQIYYESHKSWLAGIGVDEAEDLFDPYVNSRAAYVLYQRSGGWSPWGF